MMSWRDFRTTYPDGSVLSRNTGYVRPYGRNPYAGYDTRWGPIAGFFRGARDARLPALERVVAVDWGGSSVAYACSLLSRTRVVNDEVDGIPVVAFWVAGTASALDAARGGTWGRRRSSIAASTVGPFRSKRRPKGGFGIARPERPGI
jgi:hypothetical protein